MDSRRQQEGAGSERRRHPRVQVTALEVPLAVRAILSGEQVTARLVDVSLGGCCIAVPAAQAQTLVDNGACLCALPVGIADYPIEYAAAVVGRRGLDMELEHYVHLCFNRVSGHRGTLLARWIATLAGQVRTVDASLRRTRQALRLLVGQPPPGAC